LGHGKKEEVNEAKGGYQLAEITAVDGKSMDGMDMTKDIKDMESGEGEKDPTSRRTPAPLPAGIDNEALGVKSSPDKW